MLDLLMPLQVSAACPLVQVKERVLQNDWSFAVQAKKYTHWMEAQVGGARWANCTAGSGWSSACSVSYVAKKGICRQVMTEPA